MDGYYTSVQFSKMLRIFFSFSWPSDVRLGFVADCEYWLIIIAILIWLPSIRLATSSLPSNSFKSHIRPSSRLIRSE